MRGLRRGGTGCSTKGDQAQAGWEPGLALEDTGLWMAIQQGMTREAITELELGKASFRG